MGLNMARRLTRGGHEVTGYNRHPDVTKEAEKEGIRAAYSLEELVSSLSPERVVWLMVPAGAPVDESIEGLKGLLSAGDIVVDGGNSFYKDALRRAETLGEKGISFLALGGR